MGTLAIFADRARHAPSEQDYRAERKLAELETDLLFITQMVGRSFLGHGSNAPDPHLIRLSSLDGRIAEARAVAISIACFNFGHLNCTVNRWFNVDSHEARSECLRADLWRSLSYDNALTWTFLERACARRKSDA